MEQYIPELIKFLECQLVNREIIEDSLMRENMKLFCFDKNKSPGIGGIGRKSYEDILNDYPDWLKISDTVKSFVYTD